MELMPNREKVAESKVSQDWEQVMLGAHVTISSGESPSQFQFSGSGIPYFKVEQLGNSSKYLDSGSTPYHFERGKTVPKGSVIFAKRGAAIALNRVRILSEDSFMDTNLMALSTDEELDSEYLYYVLSYIGLWGVADTTSVPQINNKHIKPFEVPLPAFSEQRAIATALSDVDALLDGLDRIIAKKRDIKQAAMQQLLTGKTRLPGFEGEWEVKRIGDFTDCTAGGTPSTLVQDYWGGTIRWMSSGELNFKIVNDVEGRITELGLRESSTKMIPACCVLVGLAGQGKTRGTVAINTIELCTNQSIAAIFPNDSYSSLYLYYNLDTRYEELRSLSTGDGGRGGLNLKIIRSIEVPYPVREEQDAIAAVLSDMDTEIQALEEHRAKTADLKQAMMQELLTGRTRLVDSAELKVESESEHG